MLGILPSLSILDNLKLTRTMSDTDLASMAIGFYRAAGLIAPSQAVGANNEIEALLDNDSTTTVAKAPSKWERIGMALCYKLREHHLSGLQYDGRTLVDRSQFGYYVAGGQGSTIVDRAGESLSTSVQMATGGLVNLSDDGGLDDYIEEGAQVVLDILTKAALPG